MSVCIEFKDVSYAYPLTNKAAVKHLNCKLESGKCYGIIGPNAGGNLEMLFIDNKYRGAGIGKKLITYAIDNLQVTKVDVNEQNVQAVGFYEYMGFNIYKRSNLDGEGKEYLILHMQL